MICFQTEREDVSRQPSVPNRPRPPPPAISARARPAPASQPHDIQPPPRPVSQPHHDVLVISDEAGADTIRQSFEPPPAITHVVSDTAGSQTIRESFEPPPSPPPLIDDEELDRQPATDTDVDSLVSSTVEQYDYHHHRPPPPPPVDVQPVIPLNHHPAPPIPERSSSAAAGSSRLVLRQSPAIPRRPASVSNLLSITQITVSHGQSLI